MIRFSVVVVLVGLLAGCSGKSSQGASAPIPLDQLPARLATVWCDSLSPCCQADGIPYDRATCVRTAEENLTDSVNKLNRSTIKYDANVAGRCLDAYASVLGSCSDSESSTISTACDDLFAGTLPAGAACSSSNECAHPVGASAYCDISSSGAGPSSGGSSGAGGNTSTPMGTCVLELPAPHGKAGEACAGNCTVTSDSSSCSGAPSGPGGNGSTAMCYRNEGLYCARAVVTGTVAIDSMCEPIAAIGQPCSDSGGCAAGTFCNAGTCSAQYSSGPCGQVGTFDACASDAYCDLTAQQCISKSPDGAACSESTSCASGHCELPDSTPSAGAGGSGGVGGSGGGTGAPQGVCAERRIASETTCMGGVN